MSVDQVGEAGREPAEGDPPLGCGVQRDDIGARAPEQARDLIQVVAVVADRDRRRCAMPRRRGRAVRPPSAHAEATERGSRSGIDDHADRARGRDELDHALRTGAIERREQADHLVERVQLDEDAVVAERQHPPAAAHRANASIRMPAAVSADRTARAIPTAPGVSPCTHSESTCTSITVPSAAATRPSTHELHGTGGDGLVAGEQIAGLSTRDERAVGEVAPVDESLVHEGEAAFACPAGDRRTGETEQREGGVEVGDGAGHGIRLRVVGDDPVVERAVRLDVGDAGSRDPGDAVERRQLVEHVGVQLARRNIHRPSPEAREIAIGDVRADRDAVAGGRRAGREHDGCVARVEAAGDVGARHDAEHRVVVAHAPRPERLPEVAVEVDRAIHVPHCPGRIVAGHSAVAGEAAHWKGTWGLER